MPDVAQSLNLDSLAQQALAGPDTSRLQGIAGETEQLRRKEAKETAPVVQQMDKALDEDTAEIKRAKAAVEPIDVKPWTQKQPPPDPIAEFGSLGSAFGLLASAFTHQPMINGLNAAAAAMNAARSNQLSEYKDAYNAWKENTELALKRHQVQHEDLQDAIQTLQSDTAAGNAKLRAFAAKYGDQYTALKSELGAYDDIISIGEKRQATALQLASVYPKLKIQGDLLEASMELRDARARGDQEGVAKAEQKIQDIQAAVPPTAGSMQMTIPKMQALSAQLRTQAANLPDGDPQKTALLQQANDLDQSIAKTKETSTPGTLSDEAANTVADRILAGDPNATKNMSRSKESMAKVQEALTKKMKEQHKDAFDILVTTAGVKADQTSLNSLQKMTDAAISFEKTAERNFDLALKAAPKAVPNLGPWFNKWVETGETGVGNPDVPEYITYLLTGANEYAKIMAGSTGAQGSTVDSRNEAREIFSPYFNTGQINAVVQAAKRDMTNRQTSLNAQVTAIKQRMRGDNSGGDNAPINSLETPAQSDPLGIR